VNRLLLSLRSVLQLLVPANIVPSSLILFSVMIETVGSSETSVLTRATRCHVSGDGILRLVSFPTTNLPQQTHEWSAVRGVIAAVGTMLGAPDRSSAAGT
jgi:hypothetical protein